jgi:hypothetical protein
VVGVQERYSSLAPLYYRGASAATVVYDITNAETFKKARFWVKELQKHANPGIIIALVGNKSDMSATREVPFEVSALSAAQWGLCVRRSRRGARPLERGGGRCSRNVRARGWRVGQLGVSRCREPTPAAAREGGSTHSLRRARMRQRRAHQQPAHSPWRGRRAPALSGNE